MQSERVLAFVTEWFDPVASLGRVFRMNFFPDNTLELMERSTGTTFLKRIFYEDVHTDELYIGNRITIFNRQMLISDYADEGTRIYVTQRVRHAVCIGVGAAAVEQLPNLLNMARDNGLTVSRIKTFLPSSARSVSQLQAAVDHSSEDGEVAILIEVVTQLCEDPQQQLDQFTSNFSADDSLSELFQWVDVDPAEMEDLVHAVQNLPAEEPCTLCVVKPHVFKDGRFPEVLTAISDRGFSVASIEKFSLTQENVTEWFDVYKGVFPDYTGMVAEMLTGPVVVLQIRGSDTVVEEFRDACGPIEPEVARAIAPDSLRAQFGTTRVRNGLHCTDMPEDGKLEVAYFRTLSAAVL